MMLNLAMRVHAPAPKSKGGCYTAGTLLKRPGNSRQRIGMRFPRRLMMVVGGLSTGAIFFFGTLFAIDYFAPDFNGQIARSN
jgi:hypothetical protein